MNVVPLNQKTSFYGITKKQISWLGSGVAYSLRSILNGLSVNIVSILYLYCPCE
jgi:hypothetical protein